MPNISSLAHIRNTWKSQSNNGIANEVRWAHTDYAKLECHTHTGKTLVLRGQRLESSEVPHKDTFNLSLKIYILITHRFATA